MLSTFALGILGGVVAELLRWFRIREILHKGIPDYAKRLPYWLVTLGMIASGGFLALVYSISGIEIQPIIAVNIGASAPMILGALTNQVAELPSISN